MSDITDKTLKAIEDKKISPTPKWQFLAKEYLLWLFFILSIFVGALAFDTIIFIFQTCDFFAYKYMNHGFTFILFSIPYLWIIAFTLFIFFAYYNLKYTKKGYKHQIYDLIAASLVLSLIGGIIFYFIGINSQIHNMLSNKVGFYNRLVHDRDDIWENPKGGLLSGQIIFMYNPDNFILKDLNGKIWYVEGKKIEWFGKTFPKDGIIVKIIGYIEKDNIFFAKKVRPW